MGYGIVNIDVQYYVNPELTFRAGVENVFDKDYQRHLGEYNRVKGRGVAVMNRLPAQETSAWAALTYSFEANDIYLQSLAFGYAYLKR